MRRKEKERSPFSLYGVFTRPLFFIALALYISEKLLVKFAINVGLKYTMGLFFIAMPERITTSFLRRRKNI